jgi:hypothetical protein
MVLMLSRGVAGWHLSARERRTMGSCSQHRFCHLAVSRPSRKLASLERRGWGERSLKRLNFHIYLHRFTFLERQRAHGNDLKVRQGQSFIRANLKLCGRGGIGRRIGLKRKNLSARRETGGAELLKFGEPCNMAIASQARPEMAGKV